MGTLTANVISTTYKNLIFQKTDNKIYYTNASDVDTEITTFATALTLSGLITATAGIKLGNNFIYASDGGTTITLDTSDNVAITGDLIVTGNDIKTGNIGSSTTAITMSGANVTIAGDLTVTGGNITNAIICDSTLGVVGDLTVAGDDIIIGGSDDATDKTILFKHDAAKAIIGIDDTHDRFIINADNSGAFDGTVLNNDFSIDTSGNCYIKGDLTLTGGNITTALQCDSTLGVTGITTLANNLVFTGARDIIFTDASGLEIKDTGGSTYFAMISDTISVSQPMTCSSKVLLSGNTGPSAGTGITAASGEVYKSWVERYGSMIKTSIYIDINSLQANGDQKVIGKDATANCHLGQITTALNGAIVGGKMTCIEQPATGDRDIDLCFDDASDGTEAADLTGETDLIDRAGDWAVGEIRTFGTVITADNYLYLRTGTNASDAAYSAGKFLIELWGTV